MTRHRLGHTRFLLRRENSREEVNIGTTQAGRDYQNKAGSVTKLDKQERKH